MSDDSAFLLYALLFRAGIIAAGLYAMRLGQVLLRESNRRGSAAHDNRSSAETSLPGFRIRLTNVTSGTIFALFGAVLVVAMVIQGNPQRTVTRQDKPGEVAETVSMRGAPGGAIESLIEDGKNAEKARSLPDAEKSYRSALEKTAPAMNSLAWIYAQEGKAPQGRVFASAAVELDSDNPHYLDTLAEAEFRAGNRDLALQAIEKAAQLNASFQPRLAEFRARAAK
jgi:tetratricopeptide (TPR) repeat protein